MNDKDVSVAIGELRALVRRIERIDEPVLTLKCFRALHAVLAERHWEIMQRATQPNDKAGA